MKPFGELSAAEVATANRVVATLEARGEKIESWDIALYSLRRNEPLASDVVSLESSAIGEYLDEQVKVMLSRIGLSRAENWSISGNSVFTARVEKSNNLNY